MHKEIIRDLNMKVVPIQYPDVIMPIGVGFEVNGTLYNLKNLQEIMDQLRVHGFHYRNFTFTYQSMQYTVAQLYINDRLAIQDIPMKEDTTQEQIEQVYKYMSDMDTLGIKQEYREVYVKPEQSHQEIVPAQSTQLVQSVQPTQTLQPASEGGEPVALEDEINQYLTSEEIDMYGALDELSEEDIESIEETISARKSKQLREDLIDFKLPAEMIHYQEIYESTFLSVLMQDPNSQAEIEARLSRALELVVRNMITVPILKREDDRGSDGDYFTFINMSEKITGILTDTGAAGSSKEAGLMSFASTMFEESAEIAKREVVAKFGSYKKFIEQVPNIQDGTPLSEPWIMSNGVENYNVYTMLRRDPDKGPIIDFVRYDDSNVNIFSPALFQFLVSANIPKNGIFNSVYNGMLEEYYADCGIEVPIKEIMLDEQEVKMVDRFDLTYLGIFKDNTDIYIFRDNKDDKLVMIFPNSVGNFMFGAYISLEGNFKINYLGRDVIVKAIDPVLTELEMNNVIQESFNSYDTQGNTMVKHLYPQYGDYYGLDLNDLNENHKEMFLNYEIELNKSINNNVLVNLDRSLNEGAETFNQQNAFEAPEEGAVDLFSSQPEPQATTQPQPQALVSAIEVNATNNLQEGTEHPNMGGWDKAGQQLADNIQTHTISNIEPDPSPYDTSIYPGNIAQAYAMIMGSINQDKLGHFKTEFTNLINKYNK